MTKRSIVCATSLAGGREAFSTLGDVTLLPEKEINAAAIRNADMLFTRSKVNITNELLNGSRVRFYGTATAGTDHVDIDALARHGIAWSAAPGSNANSVAEYVIAALAWLGTRERIDWTGKHIGIIGAGHVGSRLAVLARSLGMHIHLNDPPLHDATGDARYETLRDVLATADIVSLHVPLTDTGSHATRGMVNEKFISLMKPGAIFINTSRGEVVRDENELIARRHRGLFSALLLDVFNNEPDINPALLQAADLATPHIAGYSLDGRLKGTDMVYRAACRFAGVEPSWSYTSQANPLLHLQSLNDYPEILSVYDPAADSQRLRACPPGVAFAHHFTRLREHYPDRHEFTA